MVTPATAAADARRRQAAVKAARAASLRGIVRSAIDPCHPGYGRRQRGRTIYFCIRYSRDCKRPRRRSGRTRQTASFSVDLVEHAAVAEVRLLRFVPASENVIDGEEVHLGELVGIL